jgi:hypothetical protein
MIIRRVEAELFHADGQTYMAKLIVASGNFTKVPKTVILRHYQDNHKFVRFLIHRLVRSDTSCNSRRQQLHCSD